MGQNSGRIAVVSVLRLITYRTDNTARHHLIRAATKGQSFADNFHHFYSCSYRHFTTRKMSEQCSVQSTGELKKPHVKARCQIYPRTKNTLRLPVKDEEVPWDVECPGYDEFVTNYTSDSVLRGPVWADKEETGNCKFNDIDGKVSRKSYTGTYRIVNGYPRNPQGRTGLVGRGALGRWGPNHAGDPIVTRWKRDANNKIVYHEVSKKPILQFVAVQRSDNKEWALPGGMVDPGENRTQSIMREFGEEALNSLQMSDEEKESLHQTLKEFFVDGIDIYRGYVDDPRNTDNSWMETKAINFHDEKGHGVGSFKLQAGDDAIGAQWADIDSSLTLYASHIDFLEQTAKNHGAHW